MNVDAFLIIVDMIMKIKCVVLQRVLHVLKFDEFCLLGACFDVFYLWFNAISAFVSIFIHVKL